MKKILLLASLLTAGAFTANAQFEIRPFAGLNFSNVSETPDGTETQAKVGYQFGANAKFGGRLFLYPGIAYFQRNTEYSSTDETNQDVTYDQQIGGVIIPILLGFSFVDPENDGLVNFRLMAGPSVSFLTKTKFSQNVVDDQIDWKSNVWGAQVGAGLDISIFFIDATYEFGLSNQGEPKVSTDSFTDLKNNTFYISAGVRLKLAS